MIAEVGADASLREIARQAGAGLCTLYRHFPTREALLEALLRNSFEALAGRANELKQGGDSAQALVLWLRETIAFTHEHRGMIALMMSAIEDPNSALHVSCDTMRSAGTALLTRAQAEGKARADLNGAELFDLIAALAWLREQRSHAPRVDSIFQIVSGAILLPRAPELVPAPAP